MACLGVALWFARNNRLAVRILWPSIGVVACAVAMRVRDIAGIEGRARVWVEAGVGVAAVALFVYGIHVFRTTPSDTE